jgi:hypothetical protein
MFGVEALEEQDPKHIGNVVAMAENPSKVKNSLRSIS